jgi:hypothetical protein
MLYIRSIVPEPDPADGLISRACMAKYLLGLMAEDFSETYFFLSWADELPFLYWRAAHGDTVEVALGSAELPDDERKLVLELATVAGGWWIASPSHGKQGEAFLSIEEWRRRVADLGI